MPNRNAESRFAVNPVNIDIPRSRFDRSHDVKTTFNVGDLIPIDLEEVLPGDTWSIKTSKVVRLQTLIKPIMDNLYLDTYWFFVPNRLVWKHWKEFCGENTESAWIPETEYSVPQVTAPANTGWLTGSLADYFGVPVNIPYLSVSALPFRAYSKIVNDWFRDENLDDPTIEFDGDANIEGQTISPDSTTSVEGRNLYCVYGAAPFRVAKYHDYFTSCLPGPLKGPTVYIGQENINGIPVVTSSGTYSVNGNPNLTFGKTNGASFNSNKYYMQYTFGVDGAVDGVHVSGNASTGSIGAGIAPNNLYADMSGGYGINISELRTAFQIQRFYERAARGGTRYIEILKSFFGVTSPDYRVQRSEYLGGNRIPIMVSQVIQQSQTSENSPQGNVAGISVTTDTHNDFTHSFTEHGYVIGLAVVRYKHSYQQGLNRLWSRKTKFDYYWPVFAHISEQGVRNKEIYAVAGINETETNGEDRVNQQIFGYQEAWSEYRYHPDIITGQFRSQYSETLDSWHLGDYYTDRPSLSSRWMREDPTPVDRVIAINHRVSDQFLADFYFDCKVTRPMPIYSVPGLMDHM